MKQTLIYAVFAAALVAAFFAGYYLQALYFEQEKMALLAELESLRGENEGLEEELNRLRSSAQALKSSNVELRAKLEEVEKQVDELLSKLRERESELEELSAELEASEAEAEKLMERLEAVREAVKVLEKDKELLLIISSDVPGAREDAERFWNDTREFVRRSYPNLLPTIDKILYYLDYYFDWLEARPQTEEKDLICDWIFSYTVEADQYGRAIDEFRSEAYQIIISHIGAALMEVGEAG